MTHVAILEIKKMAVTKTWYYYAIVLMVP